MVRLVDTRTILLLLVCMLVAIHYEYRLRAKHHPEAATEASADDILGGTLYRR
jgi:hypothetical protein